MAMSEMLTDGVKLMLLGMGIVFSFLILLVVVMNGMSRLARAIEGAQPATASGTQAGSTTGEADDVFIAVIGAAIRRYRATHR